MRLNALFLQSIFPCVLNITHGTLSPVIIEFTAVEFCMNRLSSSSSALRLYFSTVTKASTAASVPTPSSMYEASFSSARNSNTAPAIITSADGINAMEALFFISTS